MTRASGILMPMNQVNLDALIPREDFEARDDEETSAVEPKSQLSITDLTAMYAQVLRKPDFQRDTSNWSPEKVAGFIKSFVDAEVIPSVIMWRSPTSGLVFVVDGAHRLSALLAWINDDYGAGQKSLGYFRGDIPAEQKKLHKETQDLIERTIGSYKALSGLVGKRDARANALATSKLDVQWVKGKSMAAEASFFRINSAPVNIDKVELSIIKARAKPNAIATRALMRAGGGHKYWSIFF